jgi:amidophosphoribosyltransferase
MKRDGRVDEKPFTESKERRACSFERIYYSRGSDRDIYLERKKLGEQLTTAVLEAVEYDFKHTVFSFIPNTAEAAFFGLMEGIEKQLNEIKQEKIEKHLEEINKVKDFDHKKLKKILQLRPRIEKLVVKDEKLRTFIADTSHRGELVSHVYDVTYGIVENEKDTLVLLDDSIVRGTTSKKIVRMVREAGAKEVHVRISCPPTISPCFYGVDTPERSKLLAAQMNLEAMRSYIGCDSLAFISIDGLYRALGEKSRAVNTPQYCDACFTGEYPPRLTDQLGQEAAPQLGLLAEGHA